MTHSASTEEREAQPGLGNLLAELDKEAAYRTRPRTGRREETAVSVLVLASGRKGNMPIRQLLDDQQFRTFAILPSLYDPSATLPPHQVVFNAIGDADLCGAALEEAMRLVERSLAPVINSPAAVLATGRVISSRRLANLPGVVAPRVANLPREILAQADAEETLARKGFHFPLLLRSLGSHNLSGLRRVEGAAELPAALGALPGPEVTVVEYSDARGRDGRFRSYRVMMIDGRLYPLHLAISNHWKVEGSSDHTQHRAEEAEFLVNTQAVLGQRAMTALAEIQSLLGLDYAGIDFGLSPSGDVLFFAASGAVAVSARDDRECWACRRDAVRRIEDAVRRMLVDRARG
jgi:hypothetical protein